MPRRDNLFAHIKDDIEAALLEYVGTTVFLTLGFGAVQATQSEGIATQNVSQIERVLYIATAFGLSLLVSAWMFYRVTGGLFNPDVSLALLLTGVIGPVRFVLYSIAQLVGGITAAAIVLALTPGPVAYNTLPGPGINKAQAVFIEMFITSFLVLSVLMLAAEKHVTTPFAPIGIGLTLFVCHLWAVFFTGASMNTARSFGPAAVSGFPFSTQWIYWVGPFLGAVLGAGFYSILRRINYWRLNPGQDATISVDPMQNYPSSITGRAASHDETRTGHTTVYSESEDHEHGRASRQTDMKPVAVSGVAGMPPPERRGGNDSAV